MTQAARSTTDHDEVRVRIAGWRGAPATASGTTGHHETGVLRVLFLESGDSLEGISRDDFFEKFEEEKLAFLNQGVTRARPAGFSSLSTGSCPSLPPA